VIGYGLFISDPVTARLISTWANFNLQSPSLFATSESFSRPECLPAKHVQGSPYKAMFGTSTRPIEPQAPVQRTASQARASNTNGSGSRKPAMSENKLIRSWLALLYKTCFQARSEVASGMISLCQTSTHFWPGQLIISFTCLSQVSPFLLFFLYTVFPTQRLIRFHLCYPYFHSRQGNIT
jgi:hypothetical protein